MVFAILKKKDLGYFNLKETTMAQLTKAQLVDAIRHIREKCDEEDIISIKGICDSIITPKKQELIAVQSNVFEFFWKKYPSVRKGNKEKALRAYNAALNRGATSEEILDGLIRYLNYLRSDPRNMQYAKGCEAWLNDDRWKWQYKTNNNTLSSNLMDALPL